MSRALEVTISHDTFSLFPTLPLELRLHIWSHAFPGPRVVEIQWDIPVQEWTSPSENRHKTNNAAFANREANDLFLQKWSRLCLRPWDKHDARPRPRVTYFNPEIDTLHLGHKSYPLDLLKLSTTAIACMTSERWRTYEGNYEFWFLTYSPKLKCYIIATCDPDCVGWGMDTVWGALNDVELMKPTEMTEGPEYRGLKLAWDMLKKLQDLSQTKLTPRPPFHTGQ
jgi:hypothetical protein